MVDQGKEFLEIVGVTIIGGERPLLEIPKRLGVTIRDAHFIVGKLSWWRRWLLRLCGIKSYYGNIKITDPDEEETIRLG